MVFEKIEQLQKKLTDKYVVIDDSRPELRRFAGLTGTVRTVNMSGRALVEFDGNMNIGWYDIDPLYLKVIDAPLPKPDKKAEKPAAKEKPAAALKGETKPIGGGKNVADILQAARGGGAQVTAPKAEEQAAPPPKPAAGKQSVADILAAARANKPGAAPAAPKAEAPAAATPQPAAADPKKMSVADIMAAARGKKTEAAPPAPAAAAAKAPPVAKAAPPAKPAPAPEPEPAAVEPAAEEPVAEEPAPTAGGKVVSKKAALKTIDEILAYCRSTDGK